MMTLTVLGKYGPYPPAGGGTSSYLVKTNKSSILLDCGSGALGRLQNFISLQNLDAVILSHLHNDHICDLLPLAYYLQKKDEPLDLYLPFFDCPQFELIASIGCFNLINIMDLPKVKVGDFEISFCKMVHSMPSYAVKINARDKALVYSGDTEFNVSLPQFCQGADALLLDCGKTTASSPHMTLNEGAFLAKTCNAKVYATHIDPLGQYANKEDTEIVREMETYVI